MVVNLWIKRKSYEELIKLQNENTSLRGEVDRLAELVSAKVSDCKVGVWCNDCRHIGHEEASYLCEYGNCFEVWEKRVAGKVQYCKKHIHSICPEFEGYVGGEE